MGQTDAALRVALTALGRIRDAQPTPAADSGRWTIALEPGALRRIAADALERVERIERGEPDPFGMTDIGADFWREVPCGHPPDPVAMWMKDGSHAFCHCGRILDPREGHAIEGAPGPVVPCDKCGCAVAVPVQPEPEPLLPRTQDEIVARALEAKGDGDVFGFALEVLTGALDYEHVTKVVTLKDGVGPDEWGEPEYGTLPALREAAGKYLDFSFGKAADHRGLSAGRGVTKMREFAWLLGDDDAVEQMDMAPYSMYGVPKLVVFADRFGFPIPDDPGLKNMAIGQPCRVGCMEGC